MVASVAKKIETARPVKFHKNSEKHVFFEEPFVDIFKIQRNCFRNVFVFQEVARSVFKGQAICWRVSGVFTAIII